MAQKEYWRIFAEEVPSDLGISMTDEQVGKLTDALVGAHENYGLHSGQDIADANWRAANDREQMRRGVEAVLKYLQERIEIIDAGSARCFDHMSHEQRLAMHEIFQARDFLRRQGVPVS